MNRFFTGKDKKIDKLIFDLEPKFWWSRLYEYPAAMDFVEKDDIVLDVACGTYHPFKLALVDKCKEVHSCDLENLTFETVSKAIEDQFGSEALEKFNEDLFDKINFKQCDIQSLPYSDNSFDKIFCISAIEHMDEDIIINGLNEIKRCIKPDGKIIITLDYPTLAPDKMIELVEKCGLKISGEYNYKMPDDAISSDYFSGILYCYNMILEKEVEDIVEVKKPKGRAKRK